TMAGVDVDTLTIEKYLVLSQENQAPGVVKLEIGGNVNFEIKSQFMRELREDTFSGNKDEDAHDHIDRGLVLGMRPDEALIAIQTMADHSQKWHDGTTSRNIGSSSSKDGLTALVNKLDNLERDIKKLKESVHAIQVGCQICEGPNLDKDFPLNEEVKQVEEIKKLQENDEINTRNQNALLKNLETQIEQLTEELHSRKEKSEQEKEENTIDQLPTKESSPGHFTLPYTIGDYDIWSMRMKQYLTHTDYALWEVIVNGDAPVVASASAEGPIPPKTAEQKPTRKNELKAKSTLLLAILNEHLLKFHGIKDAKTLWEAIKARFGGNIESKKMQKTIVKQQYENFTASRSDGLDKTYDRFQKLISQMEIHGEVIFQEDANLKLLRNDTSSTNKVVNTAHDVLATSLKRQASSSTYADDVMFSFFVNQSNSLQLDNEDLEQIDTDDLKEMDLKWQVAMLTMRVECYNCHRRGHFVRECRAPRNQGNRNRDAPRSIIPEETHANALVVQDGIGGDDWSYQAEEGPTDFALMAHLSLGSSSSTSSNTEVQNYSKDCLESYQSLQKQFDQQRKVLSKANLEIIAYQLNLESLD
ncbi:ribonuclease H-like domain-containing protein, partial [Tanacetum coccineum]